MDELAGYISASASDMCSLSVNPEKCAIFQETVNKICQIKLGKCQNVILFLQIFYYSNICNVTHLFGKKTTKKSMNIELSALTKD